MSGRACVMAAVESVAMGEVAEESAYDRQRLELAALSAPAVLFTVGMIAFPLVYTVWLSASRAFRSTGQAVLRRPRQLRQARFGHRVLARAVGDAGALCAVACAAARARGVAGAGAVSCQAPVGHRALALHLAVHDAAGRRRHDVARDPRSLARRGELHPDLARAAAVGLAGLADMGRFRRWR